MYPILDFNNIDSSWSFQESGEMESIDLLPDRAILTAGGYPASTHYARIRQTEVQINPETLFTLESEIELPNNFYDKQTSYLRFIGTDNYNIALNEDSWRIFLCVYADQFPRLIAQHQNYTNDLLWVGDKKLPLGKHKYDLVIRASDISPLTELYIDNVLITSSILVNIPKSLTDEEKIMTRFVFGIDGAASYDTSTISFTVYSAGMYVGNTGNISKGCGIELFSRIFD